MSSIKKLSGKPLEAAAKKIKVVLMDVDGVLTNGWLWHFVRGAELVELKGVHTQDSIGLHWMAQYGLRTGCISGRNSQGIAERFKMLEASWVFQGRLDKAAVFKQICEEAKVTPDQVAYIGDDIPDVPVIKLAGLGIAVANARPEVKAAAKLVTKAKGGDGAVREVAELLLKANGSWKAILQKYGV